MTEPTPPSEPSTPTPPTGWKPRNDDGEPRGAALIGGVVLLLIGGWFFLDRTLGLEMPDFEWGNLWPVILIAVGVWLLFRAAAMRRG
jgi:hypothetical protein